MNGREPEAVRLSIVPEGKTVKVRELLTTGQHAPPPAGYGTDRGDPRLLSAKEPGRGPGRLSHPGGRCRAAQRGFLPDPGGWASELNPSPFTSEARGLPLSNCEQERINMGLTAKSTGKNAADGGLVIHKAPAAG